MANYYPWLDDQKGQNYDTYTVLGETADVKVLNGQVHHAPAFAHVEFMLTDGQEVLSDGGAMIWKDASLKIDTVVGECCPALWRRCAGESCCQNKYSGPGRVAFSFKLPGDMKPFSLNKNQGWKLQAGAFVCGTLNCVVSTTFAGCYACICGAEEVWLTKVTLDQDVAQDVGVFYAGGYGAITKHNVADGDTFMMSSGLFFATEQSKSFDLAMPGGCLGCLCGGEGLVCAIRGPAIVFTQNRNPAIWKNILRAEAQKKGGQQNSSAAN